MVKKAYKWTEGAQLEDHSKKKHAILREYFYDYLLTRCQNPRQEKFRLIVVDAFAGGGTYACGAPGSPLIFVEVLDQATNEINLRRKNQGLRNVRIECLLLLNDKTKTAIETLKTAITPSLIKARENEHLHISEEYNNTSFEDLYPSLKDRMIAAKCGNVFFNLDQCGHKHVTLPVIRDIISTWRSAEILLTFAIQSLLTYLSPKEGKSSVPLDVEVQKEINALLQDENASINKEEWLGIVERLIYDHFKSSAVYVSPFSINNPNGWQYWLMHFANSYRARQVYNNILHSGGALQAHFGGSGLRMLSHSPEQDAQLYLFDDSSRQSAQNSLHDEIPSFVSESGDAMGVREFYESIYSETPAHSDDIHEMIIKNPDIDVITPKGGKRQKPSAIKPGDTLKLKSQKSFSFGFPHV